MEAPRDANPTEEGKSIDISALIPFNLALI
jgi:hypothetical protein